MIIPFEHNYLHISDMGGKYIPTVINDYFRKKDTGSGYVLCVNEKIFAYVFFEDKKILSERAYCYPSGNRDSEMIDFNYILSSDRVDVFLNEITDKKILNFLNGYNLFMHDIFIPHDLANKKLLKKHVKKADFNGILACRQGYIVNMAFFRKGKFIKFSYYNTDSRSFAEETEESFFWSYIETAGFAEPVFIIKNLAHINTKSPGFHPGRWLKDRDIILKDLMIYIDVFTVIMGQLRDSVEEKRLHAALNGIISKLRAKYKPLYKELIVSHNNTVNWQKILMDRNFIPLEFRFSEYHLYLDEILKKLLIVVLKFEKHVDIKHMLDSIGKYIALYDYKEAEIRQSVRRIEQILGNCLHLKG